MFPGGCCDNSAIVPSSMYTGCTPMPHGVTGFALAVDRHHQYAPHLQLQQHRDLQLSYHQLRDPPMQHHDHTNMCAAISSSPVTPLDNGYRSMSSSLSSPRSSSSSMSPMSYGPGYSPNQLSYDCHGVPAHPSVADFQPQSHNQYYNFASYENSRPSAVGLNDALVPLPTQPPTQTFQNYNKNNNNYYNNYKNNNIKYNHINNNNTYTDHYKYTELQQTAAKPTGSNSSRESRNLAEKLRRQKLNNFITELSKLVPLISNSSKKLEKTSVLRLSAAFLRLNRLLLGLKKHHEKLPVYIKEVNLADLLLDDNDIYLMVTSGGKIIFVSHSVENILGYSQIDLMGQSLFNFAHPKDHDELRKNLKYQDETSNSGTCNDPLLDNDKNFKIQRRTFYLRLVKKVVSRDEQPELELVHVMGTLMVQKSDSKNSEVTENDIVLNAVVRPFNERRVTEVSMLEATREEYITRHQIDGRIIYVDHRISIVSGFMPQEVSGQLAFKYMHKDDVRWVMIALRQMYFKGQSFGSSCYRLLSKNGEFVYMRTHGFLQLNPNEDTIESFICVNTLVPPEQGKKEINQMKKRFTPLIVAASEPGIAAITNNQFMEKESTVTLEDVTEDLKTLDKVVEQMIINIPEPAMDNFKVTAKNPGPLPDNQEYMRVALLSKSIPPVSVASNAPKIYKRSSLSPQPNVKPVTQDRPSVLRVAPPISRQPVLVYNHQTCDKTTEQDRAYLERRGGIFVLPKRQNDSQLILDNLPKKAKIVLETQVESPTCSNYSNQADSLSDNQLNTMGCIDNFPNFQADCPIQLIAHSIDEHKNIDPLIADVTDIDHFTKTIGDNNSLFMGPDSYNSYVTGVYDEVNPIDIIQDPLIHVLQHNRSLESALLEKKQNTLKTKMDQQQGQLKEIQTELNSLSSNANTHFLATDFSHLKAEHEHQQQVLRELQGVHKNIGV